jgi:hypothetical protein
MKARKKRPATKPGGWYPKTFRGDFVREDELLFDHSRRRPRIPDIDR